MIQFEKLMKKSYPIHALKLRAATDNRILHKQLVNPCHQYLYNTHKYIYGVPKFSNTTSKVLYQLSNFVQGEIYNTPHGHGNTRVSTQPYQSLSVYFALSGMTSDDNEWKTIYEVINGET